MYCDQCQTNVVDDAPACPSCGRALTPASGADAYDPSQAPTVALTVGPCESCGASSLPGSTLCLPCTRAFESILNAQPTAPMPARMAVQATSPDAATLLQPQAIALSEAPGGTDRDAATIVVAAVQDDALAEDDEYEDDAADDLMAEEEATVLSVPPPSVPTPEPASTEPAAVTATESVDWSTPSTSSDEHLAIVALPPWARKGPEADAEQGAGSEAAPEPPAAEPVPWWERNGHQSPAAAVKAETPRYAPPPSVAPPASASLESTLARQAMRPKTPAMPVAVPIVTRPAAPTRNRTMLVVAGFAGIAAIGTPVMWRLAFADKPTTVSATQYEPIATAAPAAPRPERVHGSPAPAPRVYQDLQPAAAEPVAPVAAAMPTAGTHAPAARTASKKPTPAAAAAPEPVAAAPVAAPEPPPLLVATPPPVVAAAATAAPPPPSVQAEAVPLGQIYEISQVETRPSVTNRFDPVLPARIEATSTVVVIVRVLVSPSGRAVESTAVKNPTNDAGVAAAATATVRQWGFAPAKKKGQPVSCWINVGVVFKAAAGN